MNPGVSLYHGRRAQGRAEKLQRTTTSIPEDGNQKREPYRRREPNLRRKEESTSGNGSALSTTGATEDTSPEYLRPTSRLLPNPTH